LLKQTKEHCLVGVRENNKQANESYFIHPNIDTDVIVTEDPTVGDFNKPDEIKTIIEWFCLDRKRLELFGNEKSVRDEWVVIGMNVSETNCNQKKYSEYFQGGVSLNSYREEGIQGLPLRLRA
jgi:mRNA (2'-O-methyladenosine-N6-)-methyltransferase